jgi:hypothetical protein
MGASARPVGTNILIPFEPRQRRTAAELTKTMGHKNPDARAAGSSCSPGTSCNTPGSSAWCHEKPAGEVRGARPVRVR